MAYDAGTAYLTIVPQMKNVGTGIASQTQKAASSGGVKSALTRVGTLMGVTLGAAFAVQIGRTSLAAWQTVEEGGRRLGFGLKKLGADGAKQLTPILDWAKRFSTESATLQGDLVDMASRLTTMGSAFFKAAGPDAAQWIEKITAGLTDMSAATGKSAAMLMRSLGPSILNAPAKAVTLLQKFGVLTDKQALKVANLVKHGHAQAATQLEINAIQKQYAGAAAKTADAGDRLAIVWNNIEIQIGKVLDIGVDWLGWLVGTTKAATTARTVILALAAGIAVYTIAVNAATIAQKIMAISTAALNAVLAINPFALIAAAVVVAAILIIRNWSTVKRVTIAAWGAIERFVVRAWHAVYGVLKFTPIIAQFKAGWFVLKGIVSLGMAAIRDFIVPGIRRIASIVRTVLHALQATWRTIWGTFGPVVKGVMDAVIGFVKVGINAVIHTINALIHGYNILPGHADVPTIPTLARGGVVTQTGMAVVHEGEVFSGVGGGGLAAMLGGGAVTLVVEDGVAFRAYVSAVARRESAADAAWAAAGARQR